MTAVRKKVAAFAMSLMVLAALMCSVFAAYAAETGTITVSNAKVGQTYTVYRLLNLESYDAARAAYAYKVNPAWSDFFAQTDVKGVYVNIDDQGYVTWVNGNEQQQAFAQKACAYAAAKGIGNQGSQQAEDTTVTFEGLALGYYLLDSTIGALCSLDTTNPEVTLEEKNFEPTIEKKVNRGGEAYGDTNTAKVGDTVLFRTVVSADAGAQNYVIHDTMAEGLTFCGIPETVTSGGATIPGIYYRHSGTDTTEHALVAGQDYILSMNPGDGCTFDITFTAAFLNSITDKIYINIHYEAVLNDLAIIGDGGNENETYLDYGNGQSTATDVTKTYTYKFDLVKIDGGKNVLSGATFKLYDARMGGNEIALVYLGEGEYRVATAANKADPGFTAATITAGIASIAGLANGTYYLEEITPPDGYNKLEDRVAVSIADANNTATLNADKSMYISGGVSVVNRTGTILPRTGGAGTIVFILVGAAAVAAGIAAIGKRQRNNSDK